VFGVGFVGFCQVGAVIFDQGDMVVNERGFTYFVRTFQQARFIASLCLLSEFAWYRLGDQVTSQVFVRFCTEVRFRVVLGRSA